MNEKKYVMGINMSNHDRSAAILCDGTIVVAISEERLDRRKHSQGFYANQPNYIVLPPLAAISYCLEVCKINLDDLSLIIVGRSITSALEIARTYIPIQDKKKIVEFQIPFHHAAHAASAYYSSGFENALVVVADEQGHWINGQQYEKVTAFQNNNGRLVEFHKQYGDYYNISLGMFYDLFSYVLDFSEGGLPAAGKTMGLSAYGEKNCQDKEFFWFSDGEINANIENILEYLQNNKVVSKEFCIPKKTKTIQYSTILDEIKKYIVPTKWETKTAKNIAWKAQNELENILLKYIDWLLQKSGNSNLCLAGGIFLNSVVNSLIYKRLNIDNIFIYPASTDDGTAAGLAYKGYYELLNGKQFSNINIYLGKSYPHKVIEITLKNENISFEYQENYTKKAAELISENKIIGFFQSASEFGPRALGNRSILANPCSNDIKVRVNRDIKHREAFRPLAPIVLEEHCADYFKMNIPSPFMLLVGEVVDKSLIGITHYDGSARVQTVNKEQNKVIYDLINQYGQLSGKYVLLNTSFNVNGEPLVETPLDAICSFFTSDIDVLFIENYMVSKDYFADSELDKLLLKYVKKDKTNLLKLAQWEFNNGRYERSVKFMKILRNTNLFNELDDNEKIRLFYLYAVYYESVGKYQSSLEYLDKILSNVNYQINYADIYLFRVYLLQKMNCDFTIDNKIASQLQKIEAEGLVDYVKNIINK